MGVNCRYNPSQPIRAAWIEICGQPSYLLLRQSQPIRAAWIEIAVMLPFVIQKRVAAHSGCVDWNNAAANDITPAVGRSPFGLRGLKCRNMQHLFSQVPSQPIRAAWIEIFSKIILLDIQRSQPIRAAWIEIINFILKNSTHTRRSPFGLRGLKC